MEFNIQEYLVSLPEDITELKLTNKKLNFIPDLTRFTNLTHLYCYRNKLTRLPPLPPSLTHLYCSCNQLTRLPVLPPTLTYLYCSSNQLTRLPVLPPTLTYLYCSSNQLTRLPVLPPSLTQLNCRNNQFTSLPVLPPTLTWLNCFGNPLIDFFDQNIYPLEQIIRHSQILSCFKYLYYSLRFIPPKI